MTSNKADKRGQGTTLLPCPLDHEGDRTAAHRQFGIPTNYVICLGCNLSTKGYSTPEIAAEHWNRRTPSGVASVAQDRGGIRDAAIEECAKVAENEYTEQGWHDFYKSATSRIAAAIRALKQRQPKEEGNK